MPNLHEQLLVAISEDNFNEAKRLVRGGLGLNVSCDQGASALYSAILQGNLAIVQLLLENGADPNFAAFEPAATIYAEKPLDLAMQSRFLMDWDKYNPIVELLKIFGATDAEGQRETANDLKVREQRARAWQAH